MKNRLIALLLLVFLLIPFTTASAEAQTVLSINPSATTLQAGQSATLAVRITDVTDLYAYDITLHYDPSILEITSIENGSFLTGGFTAAQILDKTAGTAQLAFTTIPPFTAQSGSGELAIFKVKAKVGGNARISIENIQLFKKDATAIEATTSSGTVTVTGSTPTEASRPVSNPGGANDQVQSQLAANSGEAVSTPGSSAPAAKSTGASVSGTQPTAMPVVRGTVVPAAPIPTPEPEKGGGIPLLVWLIPLGLALLAVGYFGGNFLGNRVRGKK
jgi:hypothetical protein